MENTVSLEKAKNGELTLKRGKRYLHSPYNPQKEADQQIASMDIAPDSICLCIEPFLGYSLKALEQILSPKGRILVLDLDEECSRYRSEHFSQYPCCKDLSLWPSFLQKHIHELNLDRVCIIRSPQSEKLFPEEYKKLLPLWKQHVSRLNQNKMNSRYMGPARIRNSIKNIKDAGKWRILNQVEKGDVLLIAPGPSLSENLEEIKEYASRLSVFALSSAMAFLQHHQIPVDAVFTSDAGYWASLHYPFIPAECPLIMPLSAKPFHGKELQNLVPLKEDTFPSQTVLPEELPTLPDFGTVAALSLYWLSRKVQGKIFLAGLDLSPRGIESHAKPYGFDSFLYSQSDRFQPVLHQHYHRHFLQDPAGKGNDPLSVYRQWFISNRALFKDQLFSITPTALPVARVDSRKKEGRGSFRQWEMMDMPLRESSKADFIEKLESYTGELISHPPQEWNPTGNLEDFYYQMHPAYIQDCGIQLDAIIEKIPLWMEQVKEKLDDSLG